MKRTTTLTALALASALALTGCATGTQDEDAGASATAASSSPAATAGTTESATGSGEAVDAEHNDADVMFAQMMIPHHQQAVEMSEMLLAKQDIPVEAADFAQKVIDAQGPEIERMNTMLETWGARAASDAELDGMDHDSGASSGMSGMMSDDDMRQLEEAEGTEAARLYLEQMTAHHEGAVEMARDEVKEGQNPQAVALAEQIIDAQEAEITEMRQMLEAL